MNELKLFSFRRIIISSLVLGLIALMVLNSVIGTSSKSNSNDTAENISETTTTQEISSTSNTNASINEPVTFIETVAEDVNVNLVEDAVQESADDRGVIAPQKNFNISSDFNDLKYYLLIGLYLAVISSVFFGMFFLFYFYIYNNKELILYLNTSLNQSGFQPKISQIGKKWMILTDTGKQFSLKLIGVRKLKMEIILPLEKTIDPREFGFRRSKPNAITYCSIELLPMRLQVVQLYISDLG